MCKVNEGMVFSNDEITTLLDMEDDLRPAFVALVRAAYTLKFEWRHIIHDVVTGKVTPNIMSAYRVANGDSKEVSQKTRGMSGDSNFPLFSPFKSGDDGGGDGRGGGGDDDDGDDGDDGDDEDGGGDDEDDDSDDGGGDEGNFSYITIRIGNQHRVFRIKDFKHLICLLALFGGFWGAVFDLHPQTKNKDSAKNSVAINRYCKPVLYGSEGGLKGGKIRNVATMSFPYTSLNVKAANNFVKEGTVAHLSGEVKVGDKYGHIKFDPEDLKGSGVIDKLKALLKRKEYSCIKMGDGAQQSAAGKYRKQEILSTAQQLSRRPGATTCRPRGHCLGALAWLPVPCLCTERHHRRARERRSPYPVVALPATLSLATTLV